MASVILSGDTSGSVTLSAPAVAGSSTQTLVAATGTLAPLVQGTAVASTSGTTIDFTSIPSWVKRITVMLSGVSSSGNSLLQIQLGSGSFQTTGYTSCAASDGSKNTSTTGMLVVANGIATNTVFGSVVFTTLGSNIWTAIGVTNRVIVEQNAFIAGGVTLDGVLDRVRITTVNGTDTFDAGSINIMYE